MAAEAAVVAYEHAGPSLLASQPPVATKPPAKLDPTWQMYQSHLNARLTGLNNWRLSWLYHWSLIAQYLLPRRNLWLTEAATTQPTPNTMTRGRAINQSIVDGTAVQALHICASGLMSGLTSPTRPWFKLKQRSTTKAPDRDAQLWFDDVEERMRAVMADSNFYDSIAQQDEDLPAYGTGPMLIYEDDTDIIRCYVPAVGEYLLDVGSNMRVETFYRQFTLNVAQIVEMFGLENCPADVQGMWHTKGANLTAERIVAHAIEPNFSVAREDGSKGMLVPAHFPWREIYWLWGFAADQPLSKRGFYDPPHVCPRWATTSNDAYGRSPGMDALPDIMQLQVMTKRLAEAIEKQVRPPLLASVELKNQPSSILPGHVTYVANLGPQTGMRPIYEVNPDIAALSKNISEIQVRIQKFFFNDLFLMISQLDSVRTATEIDARREEKLQTLGPIIERFQNENLSPAIKRIFAIMGRKGLLPPLPRSLQGVPIAIEYISSLALAQRAAATAGMERFVATIGNIAAAKPDVLDLIDEDAFARKYGDLLNVTPKVLRPQEQVDQMRKARAEAMQAQAQQQQMLQTGAAAVQGANVLSDTPVGGGGSALDLMLGLGNVQPAGNA